MRGRLETLQNELRESEQTKASIADQVRESERAIGEATRRLRDLARQREGLGRELADLAARSASVQTEIERQQNEIGRTLHTQYVNGRTEPLRVLLTHEDPNRTARHLHYLTYVSRARAEVVSGLRGNLVAMAELSAATQGKQTQIAEVERAQAAERRTLEREKTTRRQVLESVSAQITLQKREYATLKRDEERLTQLVEKLARAAAAAAKPKPKPKARTGGAEKTIANADVPQAGLGSAPFASLRGRLRLPVAGELVGRFGSPRLDSGFSAKGVFIRTGAGQDVRAVAAGRVVFAEWLRGFGNLVIVDHGDGYMSLYGNNENLRHRAGDEVRTGDVLAAVGASAGQEDSGLYFELRHRGRPFDPLPWAPPR